jgi:hypothetical protein
MRPGIGPDGEGDEQQVQGNQRSRIGFVGGSLLIDW